MTIRTRVLRAFIMAIVGAIAGLAVMLYLDIWKRHDATDSLLLQAAVIGGAVGAVLGFVFSDSDWLDLIGGR